MVLISSRFLLLSFYILTESGISFPYGKEALSEEKFSVSTFSPFHVGGKEIVNQNENLIERILKLISLTPHLNQVAKVTCKPIATF